MIVATIQAQTEHLSTNSYNIYWQPEVLIEFSDFQSQSDTACQKYYKEHGLQMSASIGLEGIVDIPSSFLSNKIKKRKGYDKLYLAPVFCKSCSCIIAEDTLELKVHRMLFDVAEMCSRGLRSELSQLQSEMNINNVNTMFFTTMKIKWEERMKMIIGTILQEVLIQKQDGAYDSWRKFVDEILIENAQFSTRPEDIHRLSLGQPILKNYIEAESIIGNLKGNDDGE